MILHIVEVRNMNSGCRAHLAIGFLACENSYGNCVVSVGSVFRALDNIARCQRARVAVDRYFHHREDHEHAMIWVERCRKLVSRTR